MAIVKRFIFSIVPFILTLFLANAASAQASLSIGIQVTPTAETDADGHITYTATVSNARNGAFNFCRK